jgi:hypothetical protein
MSKPNQPTDIALESLPIIHPNAAGIYLGADRHWVCVPVGRDDQRVRSFSCFTADLYAMADWLKQCGVDTVAMESTGIYWIRVFQILESRGLEVNLVNAYHVKTVSGRKTDVQGLPVVAAVTYVRSAFGFISSSRLCLRAA